MAEDIPIEPPDEGYIRRFSVLIVLVSQATVLMAAATSCPAQGLPPGCYQEALGFVLWLHLLAGIAAVLFIWALSLALREDLLSSP